MRNGLIYELFIEQGGDDTILHFCTYFWLEFWISAGVEEIAEFRNTSKALPLRFPKLFLNSFYFILMCATGDLRIPCLLGAGPPHCPSDDPPILCARNPHPPFRSPILYPMAAFKSYLLRHPSFIPGFIV
jgi:hypothetical protein